MDKKRPKTIILLLVVFIWLLVRNIEYLLRYQSVLDYNLLNQAGIGYLFLVFVVLLLIFNALGVYFLWKPKPIGLWLIISGLVISAIESMVGFFIMIGNIDYARSAYIISREVRGLYIDEAVINFIISPINVYLGLAASLGLTILWIILLIWNKKYFYHEK